MRDSSPLKEHFFKFSCLWRITIVEGCIFANKFLKLKEYSKKNKDLASLFQERSLPMKMFSYLFTCFSLLSATSLFAQPPGELSRLSNNQSFEISSSINWESNFNEALKKATDSSKPLVILFTGKLWCGACRQLESSVISNPQFVKAISSKFVFLKIELESPYDTSFDVLTQRYNVSKFPTIVLVNGKGEVLKTVRYDGKAGPSYYVDQLIK